MDPADEIVGSIASGHLDEAAKAYAAWTMSTPDQAESFVTAIKGRRSREAARIHMAVTKKTDEISALNLAHTIINGIS